MCECLSENVEETYRACAAAYVGIVLVWRDCSLSSRTAEMSRVRKRACRNSIMQVVSVLSFITEIRCARCSASPRNSIIPHRVLSVVARFMKV